MAQTASKTCEICVSAPGSWYCLDCEQCFCESCKALHSRQKISANHEFKEASNSDVIPEVKSKCTDHNEVFSFVCIACDVPVCVCCVTEKHNGHKLSKLKDTIAQLNTKIEKEILAKMDKTSGNVTKLKHAISFFNGQVETVIKTIAEEGDKIKLMVDQYTAKRIASIQEKARIESKRLSSILSNHKIAFGNAYALNNRKISIEEQSRHDGSLLKMLKTLNKDIDELEVCPLPEFPSATYTPKIVKENDIFQLLGRCELVETKMKRDKKSSIPSKYMYSPPSMYSNSNICSGPLMYPTPQMYPTPSMNRKIYFTCSKCGRQQIETCSNLNPKFHFTCCGKIMEKTEGNILEYIVYNDYE